MEIMKAIAIYIAALAALLLVAFCVVNAEMAEARICKALGGEYKRETQECFSEANARRVP